MTAAAGTFVCHTCGQPLPPAGDSTITRPCLWCHEPMTINRAAIDADRPEGTVWHECRCGVRYSATVVAELDAATWDAICRRDGYGIDRNGSEITVFVEDVTTAGAR